MAFFAANGEVDDFGLAVKRRVLKKQSLKQTVENPSDIGVRAIPRKSTKNRLQNGRHGRHVRGRSFSMWGSNSYGKRTENYNWKTSES